MDHAAVQEWLDEAFFEAATLDSDDANSRAARDHLATCAQCTEHADALRRAALKLDLARGPSPQLRERVLATVSAVGRSRRPAAVAARADIGKRRTWRPAGLGWRLAAAALVVGIVGVGLGAFIGRVSAPANTDMRELTKALAMMTDLAGQPGTTEMVLRDASGNPGGLAVLSPTSHEIAVFTSGLPALAQGEYACWLEHAGQRSRIGPMRGEGGIEYWAGEMDEEPVMAPGDRIVIAESATAPEVLAATF